MSASAKRLAPRASPPPLSLAEPGSRAAWIALPMLRPIALGAAPREKPGDAELAMTARRRRAAKAPPPLSLVVRSKVLCHRPARRPQLHGDVGGRQLAASGVGHHQHPALGAADPLLLQRLHLAAGEVPLLGEPVGGRVLRAAPH